MPHSQTTPQTGKGKNSKNSKNVIQAARLEKSTTNSNDTVFEYDSSNSPSNSDWTTNPGKRNLSSSSNPSSPNHDQSKKIQKLFITANRYEPLAQTESTNSPPEIPETPIIADKIILPPPIFVKGVINFPDLCSSLIEIIGVDNFVCKSSTDSLKIQTSNPQSYRTLIHFLKEKKAQYHTFQLKEDKPTRAVIRNLHPTTSTDLIKSELELRLFEVRKVTNVLHKTSKCPLPLFFVDLEPTHYSNDIFKLSSLLHTKVKVEEPYKPKVISQCLNCQEYGHTRAYCGYSARCVRCSAFHPSSECSKPRDSPAKCALCSGDHPANYRGCSVYKELQRRKKPVASNAFISDNVRYKSHNVQVSHPENGTPPNLSPSYAQATAGQSQNLPTPESAPNINSTITNFLEDFKTLINPLISLLTKVISSLLDKKNE
ncbi:unnamed protein product [Macrosiphum euphorbiae]|uniref:Pre-C2HC domain-containing protein n=1 Tax=Macrosiphum euphorbiae TaxID=13131 RepID=A0AAV0VSA9_9HEMI|nr:unnamed protein product [Macrosiphum euphorbiae]